jgi:hypothetical protein
MITSTFHQATTITMSKKIVTRYIYPHLCPLPRIGSLLVMQLNYFLCYMHRLHVKLVSSSSSTLLALSDLAVLPPFQM